MSECHFTASSLPEIGDFVRRCSPRITDIFVDYRGLEAVTRQQVDTLVSLVGFRVISSSMDITDSAEFQIRFQIVRVQAVTASARAAPEPQVHPIQMHSWDDFDAQAEEWLDLYSNQFDGVSITVLEDAGPRARCIEFMTSIGFELSNPTNTAMMSLEGKVLWFKNDFVRSIPHTSGSPASPMTAPPQIPAGIIREARACREVLI